MWPTNPPLKKRDCVGHFVQEYFSVPENFIYAHSLIGKKQQWKPMFFSDFGNNRKLTPFEGRGGETRYHRQEGV